MIFGESPMVNNKYINYSNIIIYYSLNDNYKRNFKTVAIQYVMKHH